MLLDVGAVLCVSDFIFNNTSTTEIYTLSLHDALPIYGGAGPAPRRSGFDRFRPGKGNGIDRSEEHTSELQSRENLVCRLLLEKKKIISRRRKELKTRLTPTRRARAQSSTASF